MHRRRPEQRGGVGAFLLLAAWIPGIFGLWKPGVVAVLALAVSGWAAECAKVASVIGRVIGLVLPIVLYVLVLAAAIVVGRLIVGGQLLAHLVDRQGGVARQGRRARQL